VAQTQQKQIKKVFDVEKIVDGRKEHYRYVINVEINDEDTNYVKNATFEVYWYPVFPYGNYVSKVLKISEEDGNIVFDRFTIRMSWNGTGRDDIGRIIVKDVFEETPFLLLKEFYEEIDSAEDFEQKLNEIIEFIKEYADELNPLWNS
jgi:hypothetical protein